MYIVRYDNGAVVGLPARTWIEAYNRAGTRIALKRLTQERQYYGLTGDGTNLYLTGGAPVSGAAFTYSVPIADVLAAGDTELAPENYVVWPIADTGNIHVSTVWAASNGGFWAFSSNLKLVFYAVAQGVTWNAICCVETDHHTITQLMQDEQMLVELTLRSPIGEADEVFTQGFARAPLAPAPAPAPVLSNGNAVVKAQWV